MPTTMLPLALDAAMQPPVALLVYAPDDPGYGAYYPFAEYSPEWQAIRYGLLNRHPGAHDGPVAVHPDGAEP